MMAACEPVILIARASRERPRAQRTRERTLGRVRLVEDTAEAERVCLENRGPAILVIHSRFLEAPHDPRWRELRTRHPELAAIVCCPGSPDQIQRIDRNTLRVRPGNGTALFAALELLGGY